MATFAELKDKADSPELIRKSLQGLAFIAPMTAQMPASILDADGTLKALPTGWDPVGVVSTDGFVFTSDVDKVDTEAWGYSVPVRTDIQKAPKQIQMTPLERYRRVIQELTLGVDLSAIKASAQGEVIFDEPDLPEPGEYRFFVMFMDGTPSNPFYRAKAFSRVKFAESDDEKWSGDDDSVGQQITLDVLIGPEGYPVRHFHGGKGFDAKTYGFAATA